MNYFEFLCFFWAAIGILSRIVMGIMGNKWKDWEINKAYQHQKPKVFNFIGLLGYLIVVFTWYKVITLEIKYSWIIAALISLSMIKISAILFNYKAFRDFVSKTLNDTQKMLKLNLLVIVFSIILIYMGIFLY